MVLEIVRGFFEMPRDEMMKIGESMKRILFESPTASEAEAVSNLKGALEAMPKEQVLLAGMFISGLLRCNLSQQIEQQYEQAKAEGRVEAE